MECITLKKLEEILERYKEIKDEIYFQYKSVVNEILKNKITSQQEIEQVVDSLADFEESRFLLLYQKLYRYVYEHYPPLAGNMKHMARMVMEADLSSEDDLE